MIVYVGVGVCMRERTSALLCVKERERVERVERVERERERERERKEKVIK